MNKLIILLILNTALLIGCSTNIPDYSTFADGAVCNQQCRADQSNCLSNFTFFFQDQQNQSCADGLKKCLQACPFNNSTPVTVPPQSSNRI
jgi:hypothetical protein